MRNVLLILFGVMAQEVGVSSGLLAVHPLPIVLSAWAVVFGTLYMVRKPLTRWVES